MDSSVGTSWLLFQGGGEVAAITYADIEIASLESVKNTQKGLQPDFGCQHSRISSCTKVRKPIPY